jgi:hypothetical protein
VKSQLQAGRVDALVIGVGINVGRRHFRQSSRTT